MKTAKGIGVLMCLCLCFSLALSIQSALGQEKVEKIFPEKKIAGSQIIRLHYIGGINPDKVTIKPGTTVIWLNEANSPVEIQFAGKQVTMSCQNPVHFVVDKQGSFLSNNIPMGAVASLCFIEKGTFNYVVRRAGANPLVYKQSPKEFGGTITVE